MLHYDTDKIFFYLSFLTMHSFDWKSKIPLIMPYVV